MFNLIWKDILIQKKTLVYIGFYIILFGITFQNIMADPFPAVAVAVTYQMIATACSHEDKSGSDILWNSMPSCPSICPCLSILSLPLWDIWQLPLSSILPGCP